MWRRIVLAAIMVAGVGGVATALLTTTGSDSSTTSNRSTKDLGSVRGIAFDGFGTSEQTELDSLRGKPIVINYWASWCLFCIEEMPAFQDVYERVSDRVEFLGVNIQDNPTSAESLAKATGVRYPLVADPDGEAYKRLGGVSMPTTLFVDAEGRIVERFSGPLTGKELGARIRKHFGV